MKIDEVNERVAYIDEIAGDDEAAHGAEDALHVNVLTAIAEGADNPAELARAALATLNIEFARWCA